MTEIGEQKKLLKVDLVSQSMWNMQLVWVEAQVSNKDHGTTTTGEVMWKRKAT